MGQDRYDLVIIGLGSAGMVAAPFAARLGLRVAAVEQGRVGGDCLWTGCVPSKALLASAKVAHHARAAAGYGVNVGTVTVDLPAVFRRVRAIQAEIGGGEDSPEAVSAAGVELVVGRARVTAPDTVSVGGEHGSRTLTTGHVLVCTGSRPRVPELPGLAEAGFLTSEDLWDRTQALGSLVVIGGGPIGVELSQAFNRLGVAVTLLQKGPRLLPRDEPDLARRVTDVLRSEGVAVHIDVDTTQVTVENGYKVVHGVVAGVAAHWAADELLVATGRRPNVEGLGLEALGVGVGPKGVVVDERLRTKVATIYAAGDVAGRTLFTHAAAYEAVRAVRDLAFPGKGTAGAAIPWVTFTDPELAHAGLTVAEARAAHGRHVELHVHDLTHSDRARADGATDGAIILVTVKGRLVGASALAPAAGELIGELALAIERKLDLDDLASVVHAYPTIATGVAQLAAEAAYRRADRLRWLVRRGR